MMHSRVFIAFVIVLLALIVSGVSSEDRITRQFPLRVSQDGAPERRLPERRLAASAAQPLSNAVLLREYDFDNMGSPDPQGWTGEDVLALQDTFFHVDDFSGLGPEYTPISGSRSLWCGTADTTRFCSWVKLPGYGNYWDQYFESRAFDVSGDVNLVFDMRYDCEAGFDSFFVEFKDKYDQWQVWAGYSGTGAETFNDTLSADTIGVTVSFRFHFVSDFGYSDEDYTYLDTNGAVIIDNIAIRDGTGLVDAHNFEGEALGATSTGDGDWWGHVEPGFGDYTGLFDGSTVLQEDPLRTNTTHLWGFFNGSPDTYDCGGHPEQLAVPMRTGDGDREKVYNRIYSPWISLAEDIHGSPLAFAPGLVVLEFDAYMDLPLIRDVFLQFDIRYMVDGCENLWQNNYVVYRWDASPRWLCYRFLWNVVPGATDVQVAVKVRDMAPWAGSEDCHSHAPLIDDVSVYVLENSDFIVTTVSDSGVGTLRQAILNANASPGTDVIEFAFSPTASHITFAPQTPLPAITDPVIIDGYSHVSSSPNTRPQGEAGNAVITINLSGVNLSGGPANHGLTLAADNCTIRGLAINGFGGSAIYCQGSGGHVIEGNHIGTDVTGTTGVGNLGGYALYMGDGDGSTIGGIDPAARNVISGNDSMAIYIGGDGNTVQGNLIGTDATGAFALGNSEGGIRIEGTGNTVGGVTAAERNVISANGIGSSNHRYGIEIKSPGSGNMVKGNYIGTDITGTVGMGNYNGIALDASPGNIVGGSETGAGNVISGGQRVGLGIWWSGASGNIIKGNLIGTDATGTQPLGNLEEAIRIYGAPDNTIGGTEPGAGNVLAYTTGGSGITVQAGAATGNEILGNSIHSNYDIGIELGFWDGVTANDSLDLDTGPNGLQNFPVLTSVLSAGALVEGSLHSAPLTTFRIELFSNTECDPAGYGEGATYLGYESVTTDASGDAVFMATLDQPAETGTYLTATATSTTGNTSEFGECLPVVDSPALFEYAVIDSIVDVPGDQGGWARIYFRRSIYDYALETEIPITGYDMHRRVEDPALIAAILAKATEKEDEPARKVEHDGIFYKVNGDVSPEPPGLWEVVGSISARQRDQYIGLVPTLGDSAATIPWTVYYIAAYTTTPSVFFDSPADSGYSVDNIAPGVPLGMSIAYNTGSGNELAWDPSPEPDFQYYRVYRGDDEGFVPGPGSLVHETASPAWTDPDYDGWDVHYKVTALDHAGNESEAATAASVTGDDVPGVPEAYALYQNVPNPFNPVTTIRFDLPKAGQVRLDIYNVKGELVSTVVDGHMSEGHREVRWTGTNGQGMGVASGIYFYRLVAGDFVRTRKMVLLR